MFTSTRTLFLYTQRKSTAGVYPPPPFLIVGLALKSAKSRAESQRQVAALSSARVRCVRGGGCGWRGARRRAVRLLPRPLQPPIYAAAALLCAGLLCAPIPVPGAACALSVAGCGVHRCIHVSCLRRVWEALHHHQRGAHPPWLRLVPCWAHCCTPRRAPRRAPRRTPRRTPASACPV